MTDGADDTPFDDDISVATVWSWLSIQESAVQHELQQADDDAARHYLQGRKDQIGDLKFALTDDSNHPGDADDDPDSA